MPKYTGLVLVLLLLLGIAASGIAATVRLSNGDRITGTVEAMDSETLDLKTDYAGTISIPRAKVVHIESEEPLTIFTEQGDRFEATHIDLSGKSPGARLKDGTSVLADPERIAFIHHDPAAPVVSAQVNFGWSKTEGNTESSSLHMDASGSVRQLENRYRIKGERDRGTEDGTLTENSWSATASYDRFVTERLFLTLSAGYVSDEFADLDLRQIYGLGAGYVVWDSPQGHLETEAGGAYVLERFESGERDSYVSGRWAVDLGWWVWPERLELFHLHDGTISLEDFGNIIFESETGLRVPVWRYVFMTLQIDMDWRSEPAPGNEELDRRYLTTIGFAY